MEEWLVCHEGLKAYADIPSHLGQDGPPYSNAAQNCASQWQSLAEASVGSAASYGDLGSMSTCYNLFVDKWVNMGLFPDSVFQKMSSLYILNINKYGLPLCSRTTLTSSRTMFPFLVGFEFRSNQVYYQNG
ncbi:hypothetical protein FRC18_010546 [Serendipita sp. 400]|nr:hypothetical protein FRC18_010546 [Serendipita sp. 400]